MLAGNVEYAVVLHLIRDARLLLRTTLFDGDAISVRDALFLNTPVIATDNNMRPAGVTLIRTGDKTALVREALMMIATGKPPILKTSPDDSNITRVLEIYEDIY